ncbi:Uncharacterised protein [uncultured archaeon]|nr:Uncharacterised protein [uncultured archaeon]
MSAQKKQIGGKGHTEAAEDGLMEKLANYRALTKKALEKVGFAKGLGEKEMADAEKLLEMGRNYFADAQYFEMHGKPLTALAAYSYAHAWIDAGVRLCLLDGKGDDRLFTLP